VYRRRANLYYNLLVPFFKEPLMPDPLSSTRPLVVRLDDSTDLELEAARWLRQTSRTDIACDALIHHVLPTLPSSRAELERVLDAPDEAGHDRVESSVEVDEGFGPLTNLRSFRLPYALRLQLRMKSHLESVPEARIMRRAIKLEAAAVLEGRSVPEILAERDSALRLEVMEYWTELEQAAALADAAGESPDDRAMRALQSKVRRPTATTNGAHTGY
jgi:hypothetical protein